MSEQEHSDQIHLQEATPPLQMQSISDGDFTKAIPPAQMVEVPIEQQSVIIVTGPNNLIVSPEPQAPSALSEPSVSNTQDSE